MTNAQEHQQAAVATASSPRRRSRLTRGLGMFVAGALLAGGGSVLLIATSNARAQTTPVLAVGKAKYYKRNVNVALNATVLNTGTAKCDDTDDLPIAGTCFAANNTVNIHIQSQRMIDWTSITSKAAYECGFYNPGPTSYPSSDAQVSIICQKYP